MAHTDAKAFLSQLDTIDAEIVSKTEMINTLQDKAARMTSSYSSVKITGSGDKQVMGDAVITITDLQHEIDEDRMRLCGLLTTAVHAIRSLPNADYRVILEQRYICGKSIVAIAEDLFYSVRKTYKLYYEALDALVIPESFEKGQ